MDDFRKIIYGALIAFIATIVVWVGFLTISSCGYTPSCLGVAPKVERTSIPTLLPATLPASVRFLVTFAPTQVADVSTTKEVQGETEVTIARPSNAGGTGPAVDLTGDANSGKQIFADNCQLCHAAEGKGGNPNPGATDGGIPALNPIDPTLISSDYKTFAGNLDLFIEHGSTPEGTNPTFSMPAWGDKGRLAPQQIADVIAYVISLNPTANVAVAVPTPLGGVDIARPSNPGGPGPAVGLTGSANTGKQVFATNCVLCHAAEGKGGNPNPGSTDGTIPSLNPIDQSLISPDSKTYAANLDLFLEHGSTPAGNNPTFTMPAWGDKGKLTPQQIADVIAYVMSLNPATQSNLIPPPPAAGTTGATPTAGSVAAATTAAPSAPQITDTPGGVPHPSNPGGPGQALGLTGDANSGQTVFAANCAICHAAEGKGGNPNPGATAGTVPALNPINPALKNPDKTIFATNLDLFIEHGSTPPGPGPTFSMPPWGDKGKLSPQQIANVIAYLISLNP